MWCSGQIAPDPRSGTLFGDDAAADSVQVLANLKAVLAAAGCTFAEVTRRTIYPTGMAHGAAVNAVYANAMPNPPPARATVQVAAPPLCARVAIDAAARRG